MDDMDGVDNRTSKDLPHMKISNAYELYEDSRSILP